MLGGRCQQVLFSNGMVDLSIFAEFLANGRDIVALKFCRTLGKSLALGSAVAVKHLLATCTRETSLNSVAAQLFLGLARELEKRPGASSQIDGSSIGRLDFEWMDPFDDESGCAIDRQLAQYVDAGLALVDKRKSNTFGLPHDKGVISTLPLRISALIMPNNVALLGIPQVACKNKPITIEYCIKTLALLGYMMELL